MVITKKAKDFLAIIKSRKTTYRFQEKKVSQTDLKMILEAGRWAPSCSNTQPWHFVIIKDKKKIKKLIEIASYAGFHNEPALMVAIILKTKSWCEDEHRCLKDGKLGVYEAYLCSAMPCANMVLQAEAQGISSAILTPKEAPARKLLKVPSGSAIPIIIGLGYEQKGAYHKFRGRYPLSELVSQETYTPKKRKK